MKGEEKTMIRSGDKKALIICVIVIIAIIVLLVVKGERNNTGEAQGIVYKGVTTEQQSQNKEEFVDLQQDGTKVNKSEKIKTAKLAVEGLEITNIQLTEVNGISLVLADIKNTSDNKTQDMDVEIIAYNKEGQEIAKIPGYVMGLQPGAVTQLNAAATDDFANAYEIKIQKK